jgi:hypothetical protein
MTSRPVRAAILAALATALPCAFGQAPITIVVVDPPGVGFNDPTPAEPVGGNTGTTIGEQRQIVFQYAAAIWSSKLESPVPIRIRSSFEDVPCTVQSGMLGGTRVPMVFASSSADRELLPNVWYPAALANRLSEKVLEPDVEEIVVVLNRRLGEPDCLPKTRWYYGLDGRAAASESDLVVTLLHEFAHGLGFGVHPYAALFSKFRGKGDVYTHYVFDVTAGKSWGEMTDEERDASLTNTRNVVWNGINVGKATGKSLKRGTPVLRVTGPDAIAGDYYVGTASFGAPLNAAGVSGEIAIALDEANSDGPSTTDACSPLQNLSQLAGRVAVADRGTCSFVQKARNAQAAGAVGLVVVNNVESSFAVGITGTDPSITIPVVHITLANGNTLKRLMSSSGAVNVALLVDENVPAGADRHGRPLLFNPSPFKDGSQISHWDPSASPDQLMEPDISPEMTPSLENDLTEALLRDLGWFADFDGVPDGVDECPGSDRNATVMIQNCDTRIPNTTFANGCRISDYFKPCASVDGPGAFVSCVDLVRTSMLASRLLERRDSGKIVACAARPKQP